MKLQTNIPLKLAENQMDFESQILILGSCFAENMGDKLSYFKFRTLQNPFGILFHPLAIEKLISKTVRKEAYLEEDVFFLNERWYCFDAHSVLSDVSKEKLLEQLNQGLEKTNQQIAKATHVIITLGTAWVYRKTETHTVVANCHKVPQEAFSKELLSIAEIARSLKEIIKNIQILNSTAQFIFTVSPVRHLKDGFVENQRSKAHLIAAIHKVLSFEEKSRKTSYFPSYEIMMDELRDYRFYEADMIHPNGTAIEYIWEKFLQVWIDQKVHPVLENVDSIQKGLKHRAFNPESEQHGLFLKSLDKKIAYLQQEYPYMEFNR